ncbi:swi5-dependent recombination DNA repair protein 1 homolog isoform X1 [Hylaeus anthracinus]|uniref:swi5-dependent recombination DNA repair protein 1 homolog isoform X1 n=2 Tax=Hylaeus anthracinus TaxID=313031 RepID=UPI0023BA099A|nr:swi5-dependent recombination DNA repair protein 1 homolog isoform X1 [Hylaeus anthracinus]
MLSRRQCLVKVKAHSKLINMSAKPFRNSKGVNRPFRSPFSTPKNDNTKNNTNTPESNTSETPLRVSVSKRLLFQTPPTKKLRLSNETYINQTDEQNKELRQSDLDSLKKRIQEKQELINNLKTTLLYKKKNKAEDLETAIKKWTDACQNALRDYQNDLQERNGRSVKMVEILSSLGIEPNTVQFYINDDTFL